jgi:DNA-directed RNA polymerase specialized sigma24 family protein
LDTERNSIIRAKKDLQEFDYLYRKYYPIMNNFIFHRVNDEAVRNEIVSNVFFKAMKRLSLPGYTESQ